jgi:putative FmdB family regulatory protein
MPLYDFVCHACGVRFEERTSPDTLPACPDCGTAETERVPAGFAGPFTVRPTGLAARRSDALRRAREEQRLEGREARRGQREERGDGPPPKPRPEA